MTVAHAAEVELVHRYATSVNENLTVLKTSSELVFENFTYGAEPF